MHLVEGIPQEGEAMRQLFCVVAGLVIALSTSFAEASGFGRWVGPSGGGLIRSYVASTPPTDQIATHRVHKTKSLSAKRSARATKSPSRTAKQAITPSAEIRRLLERQLAEVTSLFPLLL